MSQRFSLVLRSMYGENAEIGSLSGATIGIIEFIGIVIGPIRRVMGSPRAEIA